MCYDNVMIHLCAIESPFTGFNFVSRLWLRSYGQFVHVLSMNIICKGFLGQDG